MEIDVASAGLGLLVGGVVSALTAWAVFGRFIAKDIERERAWWEWRKDVTKRLDVHAENIRDHGTRLTMLERP